MYYEVERLLRQGERVVVTGLKGTGKSTMIAKLSTNYNSFRSMWYSSEGIPKKELDKYQLFDRCNYLDRYAFQYYTSSVIEACIMNFKEDFEGTYLLLMFNDLWRKERDFSHSMDSLERRKELISRFSDIGIELFKRGILKGLLISTSKRWMSTDFMDVEKIKKLIKEEYL